jgi:hypothetical protein
MRDMLQPRQPPDHDHSQGGRTELHHAAQDVDVEVVSRLQAMAAHVDAAYTVRLRPKAGSDFNHTLHLHLHPPWQCCTWCM